MVELPKSVLRRLRQTAGGPAPGPGSTPAGGPATAPHPDANLLTAFAEKTLTAKERDRVVQHLGECSQCRELILLAFPPDAQAVTSASAPVPTPAWLSWPRLRWAALAVGLGTMLVVLVMRYPRLEKPPQVAMTQAPPVPAAPGTSGFAPTPLAEKAAEPTRRGNLPLEGGRPSGGLAGGAVERRQGAPRQTPPYSGGLTQTKIWLAPSTPPASAPAEPATLGSNRAAQGVAPAVSGDMAVAARSGRAPEVASLGASAKAPQPARTVLARVEAVPAAPPLEKKAQAPTPSGAPTPVEAESRPSAGLTAISPPSSNGLFHPSRMAQSFSVDGQIQGEPGALNAHWSISSSARIQRSLDGGLTWEELHIDDTVVFRVVTARAGDVWAGGSKGAVYYSDDEGAHWVRVTLSPGPADAIVAINFRDRLHGSITTATGDKWTTADAGKHWARQ